MAKSLKDKVIDALMEAVGADARIEIDVELANKMPPEQVREAVDICPVGTILEKGVGYDEPIGERRYDVESVRDRALEPSRRNWPPSAPGRSRSR